MKGNRCMRNNEAILVLDFGGQYSQLIARRVRDLHVYCEIRSYRTSAEEIAKCGYRGIIFSGGPNSVYADKAPRCDAKILSLGVPVLGICYGAQLMAQLLGGTVASSQVREYGKTPVDFQPDSRLVCRSAEKIGLLDEPYRSYFRCSGRLPRYCVERGVPDGGNGECGTELFMQHSFIRKWSIRNMECRF